MCSVPAVTLLEFSSPSYSSSSPTLPMPLRTLSSAPKPLDTASRLCGLTTTLYTWDMSSWTSARSTPFMWNEQPPMLIINLDVWSASGAHLERQRRHSSMKPTLTEPSGDMPSSRLFTSATVYGTVAATASPTTPPPTRNLTYPSSVHTDSDNRNKFDDKSWEGTFVGYAGDSPAWLFYKHNTGNVLRSRSVLFDEHWTHRNGSEYLTSSGGGDNSGDDRTSKDSLSRGERTPAPHRGEQPPAPAPSHRVTRSMTQLQSTATKQDVYPQALQDTASMGPKQRQARILELLENAEDPDYYIRQQHETLGAEDSETLHLPTLLQVRNPTATGRLSRALVAVTGRMLLTRNTTLSCPTTHGSLSHHHLMPPSLGACGDSRSSAANSDKS